MSYGCCRDLSPREILAVNEHHRRCGHTREPTQTHQSRTWSSPSNIRQSTATVSLDACISIGIIRCRRCADRPSRIMIEKQNTEIIQAPRLCAMSTAKDERVIHRAFNLAHSGRYPGWKAIEEELQSEGFSRAADILDDGRVREELTTSAPRPRWEPTGIPRRLKGEERPADGERTRRPAYAQSCWLAPPRRCSIRRRPVVFPDVSSMNTSRAGSIRPWCFTHCARRRGTSGSSISPDDGPGRVARRAENNAR